MGTKTYVGCGVISALLGLALIIIGVVVLPKEDGKLLSKGLNSYLTVDSASAQLYDNWAGGFDTMLDYQMVFFFYNLTNPDQVVNNGAVANYTQHGPYIWRRFRTAVDVSFPDNGNQVQYSEHTIYQFAADQSNGSDTDLFTNVNPAYVGAVSIAGSELNLFTAATGAYLTNMTAYFTGPFLTLLGAVDFPNYWFPLYNGNIAALNATAQNTDMATDQFFAIWANATNMTETMPGNWTSMLVSYNQSTMSNISLASARALFAPAGGSLLDPQAIDLWNQATYNEVVATQVAASFNMSLSQLQRVLSWRNSVFIPNEIYPSWVSLNGLDQPSDIGYLQYVWGTPLQEQPVATLYPQSYLDQTGFRIPVEMFAWQNVTDVFPGGWRQIAALLNPEDGLANVTIFQNIVNPDIPQKMINVTGDQIDVLSGYALIIGQGQALPDLLAANGPTAGLISTKTIHDWIFNCHDLVIDLVRNPAPTCNMLFNDTTMAPNILFTGKDNIQNINTYINFQGSPTVDGVFAGSLNISRQGIYTELGQFAPGLPINGYLRPFDSHFMRPMQLNYTNNVTLLGLNSYKYVLDPNYVFAKDDFLYQEGIGFGNVTGAQNGSPVFLSLWDQLYVGKCFPPLNQNTNTSSTCADSVTPNYNVTANVIGQYPTNDDEDSAVLHIEPQTGVTLKSEKRLQVNLLVQDQSDFGLVGSNSNIRDKMYYPLSKAGEYIIVSSDLADQIKNKLGIIPKLNMVMFYVGVTVGPVLVVLGIILAAIGLRRKRTGYAAINE